MKRQTNIAFSFNTECHNSITSPRLKKSRSAVKLSSLLFFEKEAVSILEELGGSLLDDVAPLARERMVSFLFGGYRGVERKKSSKKKKEASEQKTASVVIKEPNINRSALFFRERPILKESFKHTNILFPLNHSIQSFEEVKTDRRKGVDLSSWIRNQKSIDKR